MVNTRTTLGGTPLRTAGAEASPPLLPEPVQSWATWGWGEWLARFPYPFNRYLQLKKLFYPFFVPKLLVSGGNGSPELQIPLSSRGLPLLPACIAGFGRQQSLLVGLFWASYELKSTWWRLKLWRPHSGSCGLSHRPQASIWEGPSAEAFRR